MGIIRALHMAKKDVTTAINIIFDTNTPKFKPTHTINTRRISPPKSTPHAVTASSKHNTDAVDHNNSSVRSDSDDWWFVGSGEVAGKGVKDEGVVDKLLLRREKWKATGIWEGGDGGKAARRTGVAMKTAIQAATKGNRCACCYQRETCGNAVAIPFAVGVTAVHDLCHTLFLFVVGTILQSAGPSFVMGCTGDILSCETSNCLVT